MSKRVTSNVLSKDNSGCDTGGACECLKMNIELHGADARVFECGLSDASR